MYSEKSQIPKYPKAHFNPAYLPEGYEDNNAINAIIEIRALWAHVIKEAFYNYSNAYSQLVIPLSKAVIQMCKNNKEGFAVYDKKMETWLVESKETNYKYCYSGKDFEEFNTAKVNATGNRLLLVGKYTTLMQEPNLLRETKTASALFDNFRVPNLRLIVGVPGCGKTTYIINNHRIMSLVLTSCTEGAADIRSRMGKLRNCEANTFRDSYRTIDSYLLNSRGDYGEVWIDEALMEHPGKLFLVCLFSDCHTMFLMGDPNQLGYINRVKGIKLLYDKSSSFFRESQCLNTSYRCPVDVMTVISCKYDSGAYSTSNVLRSMKSKNYTSLKDVPKAKETKYLVFKQAEKKLMQKAGYDVSTIHEFQGKEAKHVIIVRMSRSLRESLYESAPHILVGITRHRESLVYYTPVADGLKKFIMMRLTNKEVLKHQILPKQPSKSSAASIIHPVATIQAPRRSAAPKINPVTTTQPPMSSGASRIHPVTRSFYATVPVEDQSTGIASWRTRNEEPTILTKVRSGLVSIATCVGSFVRKIRNI